MGFTLSSIADDTRKDLFGDQSLVIGFGLRVSNSLRIGIGELVFKEIDPNPLSQDESLTSTIYVSLSFDWDIAKTLGKPFK